MSCFSFGTGAKGNERLLKLWEAPPRPRPLQQEEAPSEQLPPQKRFRQSSPVSEGSEEPSWSPAGGLTDLERDEKVQEFINAHDGDSGWPLTGEVCVHCPDDTEMQMDIMLRSNSETSAVSIDTSVSDSPVPKLHKHWLLLILL